MKKHLEGGGTIIGGNDFLSCPPTANPMDLLAPPIAKTPPPGEEEVDTEEISTFANLDSFGDPGYQPSTANAESNTEAITSNTDITTFGNLDSFGDAGHHVGTETQTVDSQRTTSEMGMQTLPSDSNTGTAENQQPYLMSSHQMPSHQAADPLGNTYSQFFQPPPGQAAPTWPGSSLTLPSTLTACSTPHIRPASGASLPLTSTYPDLNTPTTAGALRTKLVTVADPQLDQMSWSAPQHVNNRPSSPSFGKLTFAVGSDCAFRDHLGHEGHFNKKPSFSFTAHTNQPRDGGAFYEPYIEAPYEAKEAARYGGNRRDDDESDDDTATVCGCAPTSNIFKHFGRKLRRRSSSKSLKKVHPTHRFGARSQGNRPEPPTQDDFLAGEYQMSPSPLV